MVKFQITTKSLPSPSTRVREHRELIGVKTINHVLNDVFNHVFNDVYNHVFSDVYNHVYNHVLNYVFNHVFNDGCLWVQPRASTVWSAANISESESQATEEDRLMCCPSTKVIKSDLKKFFQLSEGYTSQLMRHFTSNGTDQCQNGSSNLLTPYREQPRSTRTVVSYPRPAFSATRPHVMQK